MAPVTKATVTRAYVAAAALLWLLALYNCLAYRGIFWDGASFLVAMIDAGGFHDGHTARAHVLRATQWPVVVALRLGVTDTAMLSLAYSAGLFALPTALYHLALYRVRATPVLLAGVLAIVATIYLPTSFFIVGEYNATYAAATAAVAIVATSDPLEATDGWLLVLLATLCLRSYEAMVYFGPALALMVAWPAMTKLVSPWARLLALTAAGLFLGAAVVSLVAALHFWETDYALRVRAAAFDFWQNLQFVIGLATLCLFGIVALLRPAALRGPWPWTIALVGSAAYAASPWLRHVNELTLLYPPAQYVSRTAAGAFLLLMLTAMWLFVTWRRHRPSLFVVLGETAVGRRLVVVSFVLMLTSMVPDIVLTRLWSDYLRDFRGLIVGKTGAVSARNAGLYEWPGKLFGQGWSYSTLSLLLRAAPADAIVAPAPEFGEPSFYEPACGPILPRYTWRS
jgi:hypothetical protein